MHIKININQVKTASVKYFKKSSKMKTQYLQYIDTKNHPKWKRNIYNSYLRNREAKRAFCEV